MQINSYLSFNGQCEEAFRFYEKTFRGRIEGMFRYSDAPPGQQMPGGSPDHIMHAHLVVGDASFMGADTPSGHYEKPTGFSMSLGLSDEAEAKRIFAELSHGGTVQMPLGRTFWAKLFGMLTDRFGIPWMINCE